MAKIKLRKIFIFFCRLIIFIFSYCIYLTQLIFIFFNLQSISRKLFIYSSYFASISLGITYKINKNYKNEFLRKGIHISNHDNPLDIFVAQYLFRIRTITTVDQHLKNFLPFFEVTLKNYGHHCFDYKNFNERKFAYIYLKKICSKYNNVLIYPSGSIYTAITKRFSKSVSKLSMINNLKVFAWKFYFEDKSNIEYARNISKYIFKRLFAEKIVLKIDKFEVFNPCEYESHEDLNKALREFYSS